MRSFILASIILLYAASSSGQAFVSLPPDSGLIAINSSGQAVGWGDDQWGNTGSIMYDGSVHHIASDGSGLDINDHGDMLVSQMDVTEYSAWMTTYVYSGGSSVCVGGVGDWGYFYWAIAINNQGGVVGNHGEGAIGNMRYAYTCSTSSPQQRMALPNFLTKPLGAYPGLYSIANAMNDTMVVGWASGWPVPAADDFSHRQAAYWIGSVCHSIDTPGYDYSEATAVSLNSTIAGSVCDVEGRPLHAFLYNDDVVQHLTNFTESPIAVNDSRVVLGKTTFYQDGVVRPVQNLLPAGWTLRSANDINNSNQIVGVATGPDGLDHGFMVQIPEPTSLMVMFVAFASIVQRRR